MFFSLFFYLLSCKIINFDFHSPNDKDAMGGQVSHKFSKYRSIFLFLTFCRGMWLHQQHFHTRKLCIGWWAWSLLSFGILLLIFSSFCQIRCVWDKFDQLFSLMFSSRFLCRRWTFSSLQLWFFCFYLVLFHQRLCLHLCSGNRWYF